MGERATVDRLDVSRKPSGIRDTSQQDTVIKTSRVRRWRPYLIGGGILVAIAVVAIPALTQWMGGMGIIVLAVAILPLLGIGGMQLFVAESARVFAIPIHCCSCRFFCMILLSAVLFKPIKVTPESIFSTK